MKNILLYLLLSIAIISCDEPKSLQEVKSEFANCNGVKVHYKVCGSGNTNLVFIHGWGCDINAWSEQYPEFCHNTRMVLIDLPGYGTSDKPETEYTLDLFAQTVKCVLDEQHITNPVLIGHSLGTAVCRQVIFNYPELNSKLFDVDGVYCLYPTDTVELASYTAQIDAFVNFFKGDSMQANVRGFVSSLLYQTTPEFVKNYATTTMCSTPQFVGYSTMKNLVDVKYWTKETINVPSFIMCATNSGIPTNYEEQMRELYTNMEYCELGNIGHFIMMENPSLFNGKLRKFIEDNY